jgi:hypothetical protein
MVPPTRRQELRAELAAHVEALVEARRELGSELDAAVRAALEQLGDARRLGRVWARECRRTASAPPWLGTAFLGSILCAGFILFVSASLGASWLVALEQSMGHNPFEIFLGGPLLPLAAGYLVSRWRGRHPLGSRWGLLLIALASVGVSFIMTTADPRSPLVTAIRVSLWLMTACAAAGLGALGDFSKDLSRPNMARR